MCPWNMRRGAVDCICHFVVCSYSGVFLTVHGIFAPRLKDSVYSTSEYDSVAGDVENFSCLLAG